MGTCLRGLQGLGVMGGGGSTSSIQISQLFLCTLAPLYVVQRCLPLPLPLGYKSSSSSSYSSSSSSSSSPFNDPP